MKLIGLALIASLHAALAGAAPSAPYVPASDDQIVQRLPTTWASRDRSKTTGGVLAPEPAAERQLFTALTQDPNNLPLALATAQEALQRARRTGDPRAVGQAQAALAPWWAQAAPPDAVRLQRATILQSQHHFAQSLQDLNSLIERPQRGTPAHLLQQARLTRAAVLQVQGQLDEAARDCEALSAPLATGGASPVGLLATACLAELRSLRGAPQQAARELAQLGQGSGAHSPWISLLRAELATRLGDAPAAEQHFKAAVADGDPYAQAAYADALLEAGQPQRALEGLDATAGAADALLLRRAIALKRLRHPGALQAADSMRERLAEARSRGANLHLREEARFALDVDDQPARAWPLARANWATQKEPADALLYVRAALAAGAKPQAIELAQQLQARGWHDLRLQSAIASASASTSTSASTSASTKASTSASIARVQP